VDAQPNLSERNGHVNEEWGSLQSLEFFHHAEKSLLTARGLLAAPLVRLPTLTVAPDDQAHIEFLNQKVLQWLDHLGLGRQPSSKGRETIAQT